MFGGTKKTRRTPAKKTPFITRRVPVLNRRTFLRGVAGTAVALPWMEIMLAPNAKAQAQPFRYLVSNGGISQRGASHGMPSAGALTQLPRLYEPLAPVQSKVSLVNHLTVPMGPRDNLPPGGTKTSPGHYGGWAAMVTGTRGTGSQNASGPSSDYVVAQAIGGQTPFDALRYQAQPSGYAGGVLQTAAGPSGRPLDSITSPRLAYDQLFAGFAPGSSPTTPTPGPMPSSGLDEGRSVLDAVNRRNTLINSILGAADRRRLEAHFEEVRSLERRITDIPRIGGTGTTGGGPIAACERLPDPGSDAPTNRGTDYSNEDLRNDIFGDLVAMAFACDLTRVAVAGTTAFSCRMGTQELWGVDSDVHSMTHSPGAKAARAVGKNSGQVQLETIQWMVEKFARILIKLDQTPEGNRTMLDNTVAVMMWEYGEGSHNPVNYVMPIVGGTGVVRHGIVADGRQRHPSQYFQAAMYAVGVDHAYGDVPGRIDELLV